MLLQFWETSRAWKNMADLVAHQSGATCSGCKFVGKACQLCGELVVFSGAPRVLPLLYLLCFCAYFFYMGTTLHSDMCPKLDGRFSL